MGCLRCFYGTTGHAAENQNAVRARLLQTRRCRESLGRFRGTALSINNGAACNGALPKTERGRSNRRHWSEMNEYGFERQNIKRGWLSSCHRRSEVKTTWHRASTAARAVRHLRGSGADGQPALSHRNASHCRPRSEIHRAHRRGTRRGNGTQSCLPSGDQRPRCREATFEIARQSDPDCPAWGRGGHLWRCPRTAKGGGWRFRVAAGRFRKRQKP